MARRAEQVDETRQRIVEATARLHQTIGLRATTVAAVAAEAGVTRVTVYRHFPDEAELFAACSAHWQSQQDLPDPEAWARIRDGEERLRAGLADLYRFYRAGAAMLTNVYADKDVLPPPIRAGLERRDGLFVEVLAAPLAPARSPRLLRAVLSHAVAFGTWRSLCVDQGLTDAQAVEVMTAMVLFGATSALARRRVGE